MVYCSRMVASHYNCTGLTLLCWAVFLPLAIVRYPHTQRQCFHYTMQTVGGRPMSSSGLLEGLTLFAENTSIVVGRTIVDPSKWSVPVLVSNFSHETVMIKPFSEVGMVTQISAIQSITEPHRRTSCTDDSLPTHLQELLDQTSRDLDGTQQRQLASVLLQYLEIFSRCRFNTYRSHGCSGT